MTRSGWQQTWVRILTTVLSLLMMVLIFCFSAQDADRSDSTSEGLTQIVVSVIAPDYDSLPPERRLSVHNSVEFAIRKLAHFTEYMLLGFFLRCCAESWLGGKRNRLGLMAWLTGAAYAGTDEAHQLLVDGRGAQITDVLLDSVGVCAGVCVASWLIRKTRQRIQTERDAYEPI